MLPVNPCAQPNGGPSTGNRDICLFPDAFISPYPACALPVEGPRQTRASPRLCIPCFISLPAGKGSRRRERRTFPSYSGDPGGLRVPRCASSGRSGADSGQGRIPRGCWGLSGVVDASESLCRRLRRSRGEAFCEGGKGGHRRLFEQRAEELSWKGRRWGQQTQLA